MTFELGVDSFGNTPRTADGGYGTSAQAIRDLLEAVRLAEEVGLDFFNPATPSPPTSATPGKLPITHPDR
jgi:hypothetical protein